MGVEVAKVVWVAAVAVEDAVGLEVAAEVELFAAVSVGGTSAVADVVAVYMDTAGSGLDTALGAAVA